MNIIISSIEGIDNNESFVQSIKSLLPLIGEDALNELARQTGFTLRLKHFSPAIFLKAWLSLSFASNSVSLCTLYATYIHEIVRVGGPIITYKAFEKQIDKPAFLPFVKALMERIAEEASKRSVSASGKLAQTLKSILGVDDVFITDGTEVRMTDKAGNRKGQLASCKAQTGFGKKAHATINMSSNAFSVVSIGAATSSEIEAVPASQMHNVLWLADAGYISKDNFEELSANDCYYLVRGRQNENPKVNSLQVLDRNLQPKGEPIVFNTPVKLKKLKRVTDNVMTELNLLTNTGSGESFDMEVTLRNGQKSRFIKIYSPNKSKRDKKKEDLYAYFHTNIPREVMSAEQIRMTYHSRWTVELAFKQAKQHNDLSAGLIQKEDKVEAFMHLSMASHMLKSIILQYMEQYAGEELSNIKGQKCLTPFLCDICDFLYGAFNQFSDKSAEILSKCFKALSSCVKMAKVSSYNRTREKSFLVLNDKLRASIVLPVQPQQSAAPA